MKETSDSLLLSLAKESIKSRFLEIETKSKEELVALYPALNEKRATFVTLNLKGRLRGCIGSLIAHRTLYDDIVSNAQSAAFNDPRFPPLSYEEFVQTSIELSLLSEPVFLPYRDKIDLKSKINVGKDGVILKLGDKQATFLPQVWEQLPTFELFFEHLCNKANMQYNCLDKNPQIYIYGAQK